MNDKKVLQYKYSHLSLSSGIVWRGVKTITLPVQSSAFVLVIYVGSTLSEPVPAAGSLGAHSELSLTPQAAVASLLQVSVWNLQKNNFSSDEMRHLDALTLNSFPNDEFQTLPNR